PCVPWQSQRTRRPWRPDAGPRRSAGPGRGARSRPRSAWRRGRPRRAGVWAVAAGAEGAADAAVAAIMAAVVAAHMPNLTPMAARPS
ncbi:hypothetical protein AAULH_14056, partial [Lactobacillus helveticus MTCC 5463]